MKKIAAAILFCLQAWIFSSNYSRVAGLVNQRQVGLQTTKDCWWRRGQAAARAGSWRAWLMIAAATVTIMSGSLPCYRYQKMMYLRRYALMIMGSRQRSGGGAWRRGFHRRLHGEVPVLFRIPTSGNPCCLLSSDFYAIRNHSELRNIVCVYVCWLHVWFCVFYRRAPVSTVVRPTLLSSRSFMFWSVFGN